MWLHGFGRIRSQIRPADLMFGFFFKNFARILNHKQSGLHFFSWRGHHCMIVFTSWTGKCKIDFLFQVLLHTHAFIYRLLVDAGTPCFIIVVNKSRFQEHFVKEYTVVPSWIKNTFTFKECFIHHKPLNIHVMY